MFGRLCHGYCFLLSSKFILKKKGKSEAEQYLKKMCNLVKNTVSKFKVIDKVSSKPALLAPIKRNIALNWDKRKGVHPSKALSI